MCRRGSRRLSGDRQPAPFPKVLEGNQGDHVARVHQHRGHASHLVRKAVPGSSIRWHTHPLKVGQESISCSWRGAERNTSINSELDPLDLIERNLVLSAIIELCGTGRLMRCYLLSVFKRAAVLKISRNTSRRAKSMTAVELGRAAPLARRFVM